MMLDASQVFALFVLGAPVFLFLMFLPAVVELKKPQDAGPRLIAESTFNVAPPTVNLGSLVNIEGGTQIDLNLTPALSGFLSFLPKLDA